MVYASDLSGLWYLLGLLAIFGVIVILVILIKKYAKPFKNNEKPKSDKEIAEEEVKRMVVDVDEESAKAMDEASAQLAEKTKENAGKPEEKEAIAEEVDRATRPVQDEETAKAMAKYAAEHPEEAAAVTREKKDDAEKK
jgi:flagellar biosynthesis/type III secretory pathway M-ring protein FliF/YscJ